MNYRLAPSLLSADFTELGSQIELLKSLGVRALHCDIMDGDFVPSISFGMPVLKSVRKRTDLFLDAHLMVTEPDRYIDAFVEAGADGIVAGSAVFGGDIADNVAFFHEGFRRAAALRQK